MNIPGMYVCVFVCKDFDLSFTHKAYLRIFWEEAVDIQTEVN